MKFLNIFFAIAFMGFAALQVNDPDAILWILIYGTMSVVSVMAVFEVYNRNLIIVLAILFGIYMIVLFPGVSQWLRHEDRSVLFDDVMIAEYSYIEESREFLGLLICLTVLTLYCFRSLRKGIE